jgi:hypothetical protein
MSDDFWKEYVDAYEKCGGFYCHEKVLDKLPLHYDKKGLFIQGMGRSSFSNYLTDLIDYMKKRAASP